VNKTPNPIKQPPSNRYPVPAAGTALTWQVFFHLPGLGRGAVFKSRPERWKDTFQVGSEQAIESHFESCVSLSLSHSVSLPILYTNRGVCPAREITDKNRLSICLIGCHVLDFGFLFLLDLAPLGLDELALLPRAIALG
jgi:hypothetical protein